MTRSSFWKRGAITAISIAVCLVFLLWRDTQIPHTPDFDFDPWAFMAGLLEGLLLVSIWGSAMTAGLNGFLDWIER